MGAPSAADRRCVVITGLGLVSGHGLGHRPFWEALCAGRTAIGPIDASRPPGFDSAGFACRLGAVVLGLDAREHVPKSYRKAVKVMARDTEIAVACAALAVADAGLRTRASDAAPDGPASPSYPPARVGCHVGAGLIATEIDELASAMATAASADGGLDTRAWGTVGDVEGARGGMDNLQPLWLLKYLPNMLACHVTIVHGAEGPSNTITCGEASGLLSIGESARVIERGAADASLAGGAESKINPMGLLRWSMADRAAPAAADEEPGSILRPFDASSRGSLLGEGGGLLVLEDGSAAAARGASPYAKIAGFGAAQAIPGSLPCSGADGADVPGMCDAIADAARAALNDAGVRPSEVDAVIPMGLGEPTADRAEWEGLARVLGDRIDAIPVIALTPSVGNCVAGHGALMVALAALMVRHGAAPAGAAVRGPTGGAVRTVLTCAGSLGGQAAAIVVRAC